MDAIRITPSLPIKPITNISLPFIFVNSVIVGSVETGSATESPSPHLVTLRLRRENKYLVPNSTKKTRYRIERQKLTFSITTKIERNKWETAF